MDSEMVTVCIPVYNGEKFIIETLNSVNNQTYKSIRVIIIDDFSTDDSVRLIEGWLLGKDDRYTFIKNSENLGVLKCSNMFLSLVDSLYFQLLGHDDVVYPSKISDQVYAFSTLDEDVAMLYSNMNVIDNIGNIINLNYFDRVEYFKVPPSGNIYNEIIKGNFINASSVLCKTSFVKKIGGYNEKYFFEDWPTWIKLSINSKIAYFDSIVGAYRISSDSLFHSKKNRVLVVRDTFLMYHEFLISNYPNQKLLKTLVQKFAIYSFKLNSMEADQYLLKSLSSKFNIKIFIYYIISVFKKFLL
jgi:glycosyltransferase involved in cell wall biosynthesis